MLLHLVYASAATDRPAKSDLLDILRASRHNNARDGVTGLLLYSGGTFVQALEGPPEAVEATFARIARDPRHGGHEVLLREPKERRHFAEWAMGFHNLDELAAGEREGFSPLLRRGTAPASFAGEPQRAHKLLLAFRSMAAHDLT